MGLWWLRNCGDHVFPDKGNTDFSSHWVVLWIAICTVISADSLMCQLFPCGTEKQKRGNQMVLRCKKWNGWRTDTNLGKLITKVSSKMPWRIESHPIAKEGLILNQEKKEKQLSRFHMGWKLIEMQPWWCFFQMTFLSACQNGDNFKQIVLCRLRTAGFCFVLWCSLFKCRY